MDGGGPGMGLHSALEVADATDTQRRPLSQLLLGQPHGCAVSTEQEPKRPTLVRHRVYLLTGGGATLISSCIISSDAVLTSHAHCVGRCASLCRFVPGAEGRLGVM